MYSKLPVQLKKTLKIQSAANHRVFSHSVDLKPCPIELSQPQAVLEYGAALSINCTTQESKGTFYKIGWEVKHGNKSSVEFNLTTWTVDSFIEWEEKPSCFFTAPGKNKTETDQCETFVDLILYSKSFFYLSRTLNSVDRTIP